MSCLLPRNMGVLLSQTERWKVSINFGQWFLHFAL
jgi:hypothetical protein